jgi:hypothetical protein
MNPQEKIEVDKIIESLIIDPEDPNQREMKQKLIQEILIRFSGLCDNQPQNYIEERASLTPHCALA